MVNQRQAIEAALAGWRAAERKLAGANGDAEAVRSEIERHRDSFQRLSADHMIDRIAALKDAEHRRTSATPSTHPFHQAAQEEKVIAREIWESARESDEDTPQTRGPTETLRPIAFPDVAIEPKTANIATPEGAEWPEG